MSGWNGKALEFFVAGTPAPAGSKRAIPYQNKSTGRLAVSVMDDAKNGKEWRSHVSFSAQAAMDRAGLPLLLGPVRLECRFLFTRPKGHYGTGKNAGKVKASSPYHKVTKPDTTKVLRAVEDAMTGIVWKDDSQVVNTLVSKRYTGDRPGVMVRVLEAPE